MLDRISNDFCGFEVMAKKQKLSVDTNKRAKSIVDIATDKSEAKNIDPIKAAAALGRKGGKARAEAFTPERRAEIAIKAAEKRWKK